MNLTEAQDYLLGVLGTAPVGDITSTHPDAQASREALARISRTIQKRGWWFNTNHNITLNISEISSEINLAPNVLKVIPVPGTHIVQRGSRLYDSINNTYVFNESIVVTVVVELDWDDLPIDAQDYIRFKAASELAESELEDDRKSASFAHAANEAKAEMKRTDLKVQNRNILSGQQQRRASAGYVRSTVNPNYPGGR